MKFKHKSPIVDVFVWNGEGVEDIPAWVREFGVKICLNYECESAYSGTYRRDLLFYNTIEHEKDYDYNPYIQKGEILVFEPNEGLRGMNAKYFNRNYEPVPQ